MFAAKDRPGSHAAVSCHSVAVAAFRPPTSSEFSPADSMSELRKTLAACPQIDTNSLAVSPLSSAHTRLRKCSFCAASSPVFSALTQASAATYLFSTHTKIPLGGAPQILCDAFSMTCKTAPTHALLGVSSPPRESHIPMEAHVPRSRPLATLGLWLLCASLLTVSATAQDQSPSTLQVQITQHEQKLAEARAAQRPER